MSVWNRLEVGVGIWTSSFCGAVGCHWCQTQPARIYHNISICGFIILSACMCISQYCSSLLVCVPQLKWSWWVGWSSTSQRMFLVFLVFSQGNILPRSAKAAVLQHNVWAPPLWTLFARPYLHGLICKALFANMCIWNCHRFSSTKFGKAYPFAVFSLCLGFLLTFFVKDHVYMFYMLNVLYMLY